jgi:hypothetical protein
VRTIRAMRIEFLWLCMVCVRILVGSVLSFVYSSTGSHYQATSNNPKVITLNLLLFDCTYCQLFWRFECFCLCRLKCMWWRNECVWRDECKARGFTTGTIIMTTRPLQPIEHHHQIRIHAAIVASQACLMNGTVSKQRFSLLFTNLQYVSFFL